MEVIDDEVTGAEMDAVISPKLNEVNGDDGASINSCLRSPPSFIVIDCLGAIVAGVVILVVKYLGDKLVISELRMMRMI